MTFMIENLKGELASKEALLVQEKHGITFWPLSSCQIST